VRGDNTVALCTNTLIDGDNKLAVGAYIIDVGSLGDEELLCTNS